MHCLERVLQRPQPDLSPLHLSCEEPARSERWPERNKNNTELDAKGGHLETDLLSTTPVASLLQDRPCCLRVNHAAQRGGTLCVRVQAPAIQHDCQGLSRTGRCDDGDGNRRPALQIDRPFRDRRDIYRSLITRSKHTDSHSKYYELHDGLWCA
jgi:hypothetical protein